METRQFKNKCRGCRFLGGYEHQGQHYDLYYCNGQAVACYGDEPEDLYGFFIREIDISEGRLMDRHPAIREAYRRCKRKQLYL
jgi:hypothetical protein